jgi:membrane protease YdiL (CAAX protease family)
VSGLLFALYHLHVPWVIPTALIDTFSPAYPTKRSRSAWLGIAVHSTQTIFTSFTVLAMVR